MTATSRVLGDVGGPRLSIINRYGGYAVISSLTFPTVSVCTSGTLRTNNACPLNVASSIVIDPTSSSHSIEGVVDTLADGCDRRRLYCVVVKMAAAHTKSIELAEEALNAARKETKRTDSNCVILGGRYSVVSVKTIVESYKVIPVEH